LSEQSEPATGDLLADSAAVGEAAGELLVLGAGLWLTAGGMTDLLAVLLALLVLLVDGLALLDGVWPPTVQKPQPLAQFCCMKL
jgi:hypothetical protein